MSIRHWPLSEQPRQKLLDKGAEALSDAELLAIILRQGTHGRTALDIARQSLQHFGSLRACLEASEEDWCNLQGLGQASYTLIQASQELCRRHLQSQLARGEAINDSFAMRRYLMSQLRHHTNEVFACLYLDKQLHIIDFIKLAHGTIDEAVVYPREIVKHALRLDASHLILAHNHPSGNATPSEADKNLTTRVKRLVSGLGLQLLDHFIIGDGEMYSFKEAGLMAA
ncbi:MAG: RadC family protein [Gammaproteobacteria bacterium]